ncbi:MULTISPECIES: AtpZ/AtpI family protein [Nocardiopsis]|uniref:AtpZ/AtpI family protein n=1 Tax=Nocardiopsis akebiae TaxID=2831968 RepID=A0ABX8C1N0_9ACTN|nr:MULTISPECIES: AtpZ/AtpI family protein [Nocardiopsis]MCK9873081.1 AtpZ/AtpI family protein [Nocardiopsis dassonvillei]QUX28305.1 AtpZ/AtpI family protein [Nocardiopsis akebiae]
MSSEPTRKTDAHEDSVPRQSDGWALFSTLLSGVLVWSAIGWAADELLGFQALFLPIGAVLGMAGAIYLIVAKSRRS